MYKAGDLVRHRVKAEWGLGRVVVQNGEGKVLIKFADRAGDVLLTAAGAVSHLEADPNAQWLEVRRTKARKAAPRRVPCATCSKDLRKSQASADAAWMSCPECSGRNGRQHVLHAYPEAFAAPDTTAVAGPDDAQQGWCLGCRAGGAEVASRLCSEFPR